MAKRLKTPQKDAGLILPRRLPDLKDAGYSPVVDKWLAAFSKEMLSFFSVNVDLEGTRASTFDRIRMSIPLGIHTVRVAQAIHHMHSFGVNAYSSDEDQRAIAAGILENAFASIEKWVDIAKNGTRYTVEDILRIRNIEQRMAALKIMGADRLLQESHAILVSKSARGNELYRIPWNAGLFTTDAYFLKYACVSTGRIYVSGVPPILFDKSQAVRHVVDSARLLDVPVTSVRGMSLEAKYSSSYPQACWADLAMAWKFRLSYEEYMTLTRENEA